MEILYLLVPLAVLIVIGIAAAFLWAVKSGQFDDLEGPAHRILMDEAEDAPSLAHGPRLDPIGEAEDAPSPISGRVSETADGTSLSRGPRLDPIGEASRASDTAHGPRLDPIGEAEDAPSLAHGPRLDPIGDDRPSGPGTSPADNTGKSTGTPGKP